MKRSRIYMVGLCLLLVLSGCERGAAAPAEAPAAPAVTAVAVKLEEAPPQVTPEVVAALATPEPVKAAAEDEERILGWCRSITDELPFAADLDGDGALEIVDVTTLPGERDGCPRWTVSLQKGGEVKLVETLILDDMPFELWVGDLDEDGGYELFLHGDLASDDYIFYAWRCDLTPIPFEPDDRYVRWGEEPDTAIFDGFIQGFEDGHIVVEGVVDMLGTHWGVRTLAIGDDGVIGPVSTVWAFEEGEDRYLTVSSPLTAYAADVRKDPGEPFILAAGETLFPLASDGYSRMWFRTGSGRTGVLLLVPGEDFGWLIDGRPEEEYFEFLPYSG